MPLEWKKDLLDKLDKVQSMASSNVLNPASVESLLVKLQPFIQTLIHLDSSLELVIRIQNGFKSKGYLQTSTTIEGTLDLEGNYTSFLIERKATAQTFNALIIRSFNQLKVSVQAKLLLACAKHSLYLQFKQTDLWIYIQQTDDSQLSIQNQSLSTSIQQELNQWEYVHQSPYSLSFYNTSQVGWHQKPIGSLRLSDHWNFVSRNQLHCRTKEPLKKEWKQRFLLGIYTGECYEILCAF